MHRLRVEQKEPSLQASPGHSGVSTFIQNWRASKHKMSVPSQKWGSLLSGGTSSSSPLFFRKHMCTPAPSRGHSRTESPEKGGLGPDALLSRTGTGKCGPGGKRRVSRGKRPAQNSPAGLEGRTSNYQLHLYCFPLPKSNTTHQPQLMWLGPVLSHLSPHPPALATSPRWAICCVQPGREMHVFRIPKGG